MDLAQQPGNNRNPMTTLTERSYMYTSSYPGFQRPANVGLRFSRKEILHLGVAVLLVALVGISIIGFGLLATANYFILITFAAVLLTSFLIHELAHKIAAQRLGLWAEFRLTLLGSALTLISIVSPPFFKLISPGAVMISGYADSETVGKISLAGPMTNIVLSFTLFFGSIVMSPLSFISFLFVLGAFFNAWIAVFNLIPFGVFDGLKIYHWDKKVWAATFLASAMLAVGSYVLFQGV